MYGSKFLLPPSKNLYSFIKRESFNRFFSLLKVFPNFKKILSLKFLFNSNKLSYFLSKLSCSILLVSQELTIKLYIALL